MDVVVKGMEMPIDCELCNFRHYTLDNLGWTVWCRQTGEIVCRVGESQGRPDWCPLIEVKEGEEGIYGVVY